MKISSCCYAVTGLGYVPPWSVNAGFVVGDHTTMIVDTGANAAAARTILGYSQAVRRSSRIMAINTEKHFDHVGGNMYLQAHGIEVWGHPAAGRTAEEFSAEVQEFNDAIGSAARRKYREAEAFFEGTKAAPPNHTITAEMEFDLGGVTARVIPTPGHTPTNLSVYADGVMFSGDCLINLYVPNLDAGGPADWQTWLESLDRIEQIRPEVVVAGHGPVLMGAEVPGVISRVRRVLVEAIRLGASPTRPVES